MNRFLESKSCPHLIGLNGVSKEQGAVDEALAWEENPDLSVAVVLKLSVDSKPEMEAEFEVEV